MSDSEEYSSEEELSEEQEGQPHPSQDKRAPIYNVDALHECLEEIGWTDEVPWEETQAITSEAPTEVNNVDDDLERELAFYNQALSSTRSAIQRFESRAAPWHRPPDYYAEMVKSDEHMAKVKDRLMHEQQQIEQAEERRKAREQKAYAKQVQAEKQKERQQDKKRQINQIQHLRKQREKSGFAGELDYEEEIEKMGQPQQKRQQQQGGQQQGVRIRAGQPLPSKKRQVKNAKFGFGGRKRLKKQNDAFSSANMDGYKPGRFDDGAGGTGGGKGKGPQGNKVRQGRVSKKKGQQNRPGKARRKQMKQKGR